MKLTIKTSKVDLTFEDNVEETKTGYGRHYLPDDTNKWIKEVIADVLHLHENIIETEPPEPTPRQLALFLNWALKHYSTETTDDGLFYWADSMGIEVSIETIINDYNNEKIY